MDRFDVVWVGQQIDAAAKEWNTNNLSIMARASRDEPQRVADDGAHVTQKKFPARSRGTMSFIPGPYHRVLTFNQSGLHL